MSETKWSDSQIDQHLRTLTLGDVLPEAPEVTPDLVARTRAARARRGTAVWWKGAVAAAVVLGLLLVGGNRSLMAGMIEMVLGLPIRTMTQEELERASSFEEMDEAPLPAAVPPEQTAQLATFPLRNPSWLPEGFERMSGPEGKYQMVYEEGKGWWQEEDPAYYYVTQAYESAEGRRIHIRQSLLPEAQWISWPPDTERLEVAGHPAFLRRDVPTTYVEPPEGVEVTDEWLPESLNLLYVWVEEPDGQISEIALDGDVDPEVLIQVAESMFE